MGLLWDTPEERARKERELQRQSLLGTPDQAAQIGQLGRFSMPLTPAKEGTGYLGSDMGGAAQSDYLGGLLAAGYSPQEATGLLNTATPQAPEQTSLMKNIGAFAQPGTPEFAQAMQAAVMKPQVAINNIPKPPANYNWIDPANPSVGVEPIKGGPATKPTAAEAKQMSQGDMAQVMLGEIKTIFDKGLDVSDPKIWAETELAQVPFISWATNLSPDEAKISSNLQQFENQYMAMLRGAQVGPAEQKLFRKQLPQLGQSKELFAENLKNSQRNLMIMIQRISDLRQFDQKGTAAPMVAPLPPGS
jgi:hypothetical protein